MLRGGSYENASFCVSTAIKAAIASHGKYNLGTLEILDTPIDSTHGPLKPDMAEFRRISIAFVYIQLLGDLSITPEVISKITEVLCIPPTRTLCFRCCRICCGCKSSG